MVYRLPGNIDQIVLTIRLTRPVSSGSVMVNPLPIPDKCLSYKLIAFEDYVHLGWGMHI